MELQFYENSSLHKLFLEFQRAPHGPWGPLGEFWEFWGAPHGPLGPRVNFWSSGAHPRSPRAPQKVFFYQKIRHTSAWLTTPCTAAANCSCSSSGVAGCITAATNDNYQLDHRRDRRPHQIVKIRFQSRSRYLKIPWPPKDKCRHDDNTSRWPPLAY